ncbi:hypothetical protein CDAR_467351 [Caerostris darwini]|uniref:Uncharacterized protein n=1 Tax=Caerostris darwini TaxID=1538125 RepID=A0AAV4U2B7_9ARAC|nr:hypothetical protein CDAR_467351 [Caerostris darwini]
MAAPLHHDCLIKFTIQTLFTATVIQSTVQLDDWVKSILGLLTIMTTFKGKQTAMPYTPLPLPPFFGREWELSNVTILKQHLKKDVFGKEELFLSGEKKKTS